MYFRQTLQTSTIESNKANSNAVSKDDCCSLALLVARARALVKPPRSEAMHAVAAALGRILPELLEVLREVLGFDVVIGRGRPALPFLW